MKKNIKFLDLFAGIGGFHEAMIKANRNSECIAAIEFDKNASKIYNKTFGVEPLGDITSSSVQNELALIINKKGVDILFAGFPCQAFSKAGKQEGFEDQTRGTLFYSIADILKKYRPKYFVLENVRNLKSHKSKQGIKTYDVIMDVLEKKLNYNVQSSILSPHRIREKKIPLMRERIFIYGIAKEHEDQIPIEKVKKHIEEEFILHREVNIKNKTEINKYLKNKNNYHKIQNSRLEILDIWEELVKKIGSPIPSPLWLDVLFNNKPQFSDLKWKQTLINKNIDFFNKNNNKEIITTWYEKHNGLSNYPISFRKFEWNANSSIDSIYDGIIQFRPSGIRVKKPDYLPTFVAINQTPIIGWKKRFIRPDEAKDIFGFDKLKLGENTNESYKQLGNTISVDVAEIVIRKLLQGENND